MIINCFTCGVTIETKQPNRKFCGSRKDKNSCAYKKVITDNHKIYKKNGRKYIPENDRKSKLKANFNLTLDEYQGLVEKQKGVCAICLLPQDVKYTKFLSVDHDHKTNKVRGLLCHGCNIGLGMFKDDSELLLNAIKYINNHLN